MSEPLKILVLDDDESTCNFLHSLLTAEGHSCKVALDEKAAQELLRNDRFDLALIDVYLGSESGLQVLALVKSLQPGCQCVMMTAQATVETVAQSVADGAMEYLSKPILIDTLLSLVRRVQGQRGKLAQAADPPRPFSAMVGSSPKMLEVYRSIARVAPTAASVFISGASGTGKELVAKAIHTYSPRAQMPFTPLNCGAFSETLLESELFGHEKGAFTGAETSRPGVFEVTEGGTLFLDEISETTPAFQVKLLRAVQEKQVRRVGSNKYIPVDVRILSASNKELGKLIQSGRFREDLFYRLSVVTIPLPSLEERREDIAPLVHHFLERFQARNQRMVTITEEAVAMLRSMSWPGNVRELENRVERLAIFSSSGQISVADVERERVSDLPAAAQVAASPTTLVDIERQHIIKILREAGGNKSLAARKLGIERKTLYQKAQRLGIDLQSEN